MSRRCLGGVHLGGVRHRAAVGAGALAEVGCGGAGLLSARLEVGGARDLPFLLEVLLVLQAGPLGVEVPRSLARAGGEPRERSLRGESGEIGRSRQVYIYIYI